MTYRGTVKDGVVVLPPEVKLRDGQQVEVVLPEESAEKNWGEVLKEVIGAAGGLPEDMAESHDHYVHGTTKK